MRYSKLNPVGIKPPSNTLDVDRWSDLESATKNGTKFVIQEEDFETKEVHVSSHTEQLLRTLCKRPVKASSRCRLSQYKAALIELGVQIDCEGYRSDDRGRDSYGVYFLRSRVLPSTSTQEAA